MGVGAGLYMYVVVLHKFTFAISSPDEFLFFLLLLFLAYIIIISGRRLDVYHTCTHDAALALI